MDCARTVWAEDTGLDDDLVEELTVLAEEAGRRGLDVDLDPRYVWNEWPLELERVGAADLAARVRELEIEWSWRC